MPANGRKDECGRRPAPTVGSPTAGRLGGWSAGILAIGGVVVAVWLGQPAAAGEADAAATPQAAAVTSPKDEGGPPGARCLTRAEQRARSADKTVVPLARAVQSVKPRGELLRARLCEQNGKLVYQLTVLPKGGKVVRATVDAGSGALIASH